MVECQLPKLDVAGSIPVARSLPKPPADGGFVVSGRPSRFCTRLASLDRNVRFDIFDRPVEVRQAARLAGGGDQDSAPVRRGEGRGRVPPATSATRRRSRLASFATDARHRRALSRAADHCRADADAIVIAEVFSKKTRATPRLVIENAMRRLAAYDEIV